MNTKAQLPNTAPKGTGKIDFDDSPSKPRLTTEWGLFLRQLRDDLNLSADSLVTKLSMSESKYLDIASSTLFQYESGRRCPRDRHKQLALIKGYHGLGAIQTAGRANQWLKLAGLAPLDPREEEELFPSDKQAKEVIKMEIRVEVDYDTFLKLHVQAFINWFSQFGILVKILEIRSGSTVVTLEIPNGQVGDFLDVIMVEKEIKEQYPLKKALFIDSNLIEISLNDLNLVGFNFSDKILQGANLVKADLRMANFQGSDLRRADLSYAKLEGADFSFADLRGTNLTGVDLQTVKLDSVRYDESTRWVKPDHATPQEPHWNSLSSRNTHIPASEDPINQISKLQKWLKRIWLGLPLLVMLIYIDPLGIGLGMIVGGIGVSCNLVIHRLQVNRFIKYIFMITVFLVTVIVQIVAYDWLL